MSDIELRDALDILPIEVWLHIAEQRPSSWFVLCRVVLLLGRYSLDADVQRRLLIRWISSDGYLPNGMAHGKHGKPTDYYGFRLGFDEFVTTKWYHKGVLHQDDGDDLPAVEIRRENNILNYQEWRRNGKLYRVNPALPAVISYRQDGETQRESWYQDGKLVAINDYRPNGMLHRGQWYLDGVLHRDGNLPAEVEYRSNGNYNFKKWYRHGKLCRDGDQPAVQSYHLENGRIKREFWHHNGILFTVKEYTINGRSLNSIGKRIKTTTT